MENHVYHLVYVFLEKEGKEYPYLSDDSSIQKGDSVYTEDILIPMEVTRTEDVTYENLPLPLSFLKHIVEKQKEDEEKEVLDTKMEDVRDEDEDADPEKLKETEEMKIRRDFEGELRVELLLQKDFSYADYHTDCLVKVKDDTDVTDFSLIQEIQILNHTDQDFENMGLRVHFSHEAFQMEDLFIPSMEAHQELSLRIPFLRVKKAMLEDISQSVTCSLQCDLVSENVVLATTEKKFNILPVSQPSLTACFDRRVYAKYITPLSPSVKQLTLDAMKENEGKSFIAYQNKNKYETLLKEIQAVYLTLHKAGIAYQNPPAGGLFEEANEKGEVVCSQRLRMPEEVLNDHKGTCLDLSILFCAALEEIGYHPLLVFIDGHAFTGVFLEEETRFTDGIEKSAGHFQNMSSDGDKKIILMDAVCFAADQAVSFADACVQGQHHLKNYTGRSFAAVDVNTCHQGVFSPIPVSGNDEELELAIEPKEIKDKELSPINEIHYEDVRGEEEKDRFTFWEKKLLDLTEANPLVSISLKPTSVVKMAFSNDDFEFLSSHESMKFVLAMLQEENEGSEKFFQSYEGNGKDIAGNASLADYHLAYGYERTLKQLIRKSSSAMDETGSPTLYLCLGNLTYTRKKGHGKGFAPFMVLPIRIAKERMGSGYTLSYDYDDLMLNQTFFEYYKLEHPEADFSPMYHTDSRYQFMDYVSTFKRFNTEDIQLDEKTCYIANLTFSHYIMWMDVRKRKEELKKNPVIQSILENRNTLNETVLGNEVPADELENYSDFAAPLPYDSTQLKAILDCGQGKSFILDGPPGTGKSQTIVNMIVNAFYHGKTVLFVAEKKAALDVVADRLEKIQLGRFCLELHSNKANKGDFFAKLKKSMDAGPTHLPEDFNATCEKLDEKRKYLLTQINKMHHATYAMSLYDAIVKKESLDFLKDRAKDFTEDYLVSLTEEKKKEITASAEKYGALSESLPDFYHNPLKLTLLEKINFADKDETVKLAEETLCAYDEVREAFEQLRKYIAVDIKETKKSLMEVTELTDLALNHSLYIPQLNTYTDESHDEAHREVFAKTKELNAFEDKYDGVFDFSALKETDVITLHENLKKAEGFFKKLSARNKVKKAFKKVLLPKQKLDKKHLLEELDECCSYWKNWNAVSMSTGYLDAMIGMSYLENLKKADVIEKSYEDTRLFMTDIHDLGDYGEAVAILNAFVSLASSKNPAVALTYHTYQEKLAAYQCLETTMNEVLVMDAELLEKEENNLDLVKELYTYVSNEEHFNELLNVAMLNTEGKKLCELGLNEIIDDVKAGRSEVADLQDIFDLSLANGYIRLYFRDEDINYFNGVQFDSEIKKYKDLISEYTNAVIESVSAVLTKNLDHANINYANSSPIGRLKKTISTSGRGVTIRDTLLNYDDIIKKYFPCFLMSPLSAAQYLAVDEKDGHGVSKFDLVIFDEASQIPTHEAVGPIARGKALIVAGDPEQMPPSAYFSAGLELEGEDVQYGDADSLLDECIAIELPRHRLAYHYRSRHESLISFSNHYFYNDELYTFPSPDTARSRVEFRYIDLSMNKKNSDISKEELDALWNAFKEIYSDERTKSKSVGIIVFNMKQQEKVADLIQDKLAKDKELNKVVDSAAEKTGEPYFIKSLENVQGDERDIILLSVGFRKTSSGYPMVIGPLTRDNGQRRLNVAVSRSKEKMIVLSTIKYSDFPSSMANKGKGPAYLKEFLKYAEEASFSGSKTSEQGENSIVWYLKKDLEEKGYEVMTNVGNSDFRVDLAVKGKDMATYDLGILIDREEIGDKISLRDKMYVQESMLNSLKWKIIHVYTVEYFKDPQGTMNHIIASLNMPFVKEENEIHPNIEKEEIPDFKYDTYNYERAVFVSPIGYTNDYGFSEGLKQYLRLIIEKEGPVSFETIKNGVRDHSNIQSMSSKAKARLEAVVKMVSNQVTNDQTQQFYWPERYTNQPKTMTKFRIHSSRDLYDIPKEEIAAAMKQILAVQGEISKEDLYRFTLAAFEYGNGVLNAKNQERLDYVFTWMMNQK